MNQVSIGLVGQHATVTVNASGTGSKQVLVTPIRSSIPSVVQATPSSKSNVVDKIILKAVSGNAPKKDSKAFTLRHINTSSIHTCNDLRCVIRTHLGAEITTENFDVGYIQGLTVIRIRSKEDMTELWANVKDPSKKINVWCDGLIETDTSGSKRKQKTDTYDRDIQTKRKKVNTHKEDEVQEIVDDLKKQHGSNFTRMQYRIWGEMISGGMHMSTDEAPNTTMFARAGGCTPYRRKSQQSSVTQLMTEAATAFTSALSPGKTASPSGHAGTSPAKVIESRSKLYKQLCDLQNLRNIGVLSEGEYESEKESIMALLAKLKKT